jgi:predicted glutamine amidotransferase
MAHNLKANIILGQVKDTTVGGQRTENTPPFRYRNWIFCYSGTLNRFETIKEEMLLSVPDFIRRNIRGNTDSEHLFHLFLSFLNDTGRMDDPRIPPDIAARALAATLAYANRLITDRGGSPLTGCCLLSNGSIVLASRRTLDLKIIRNSSYSSAEKDGRPVSASHLKSVVILGGTVTSQMPGWEDVAENAIVTIDSQLNIKYSSPI